MKYYLWLLPSGPEAIKLQQIITDLSRGYSQTSFPSHITMWSGIISPQEIINTIDELAKTLPITLDFGNPTFGNSFYHCVYLPVKPSSVLGDIQAQICTVTKQPYNFDPHISLMYGEHSPARRSDISQNLYIPFNTIEMGHFALVEGADHFANWRVVHRAPLSFDTKPH
jgi:hypothetical protein